MGFKELKKVKTSCNGSAENFKGEWTKTCNSSFVYIHFFLCFNMWILHFVLHKRCWVFCFVEFFSFLFLFVCFWNPEAANERCCSEVVVPKFKKDNEKLLKILPKSLGSFISYVRKIFRKTNLSYPLVRTPVCAYQEVRNVSFSENFANVINEWYLSKIFLTF